MEEEIKEVSLILQEIADLNEMISMHKENRYMHDQFLNNKAGFVLELQKVLSKFDLGLRVETTDQ